MGCLLPLPEKIHKFFQIYFIGNEKEEAQQRCSNISGHLRENIVLKLLEMLPECYKYVRVLKYAMEHIEQPNHKVVIHADKLILHYIVSVFGITYTRSSY